MSVFEASRKAAFFFPFNFFWGLVGKLFSFFKIFFGCKNEKKVPIRTFLNHPAATPETEVFFSKCANLRMPIEYFLTLSLLLPPVLWGTTSGCLRSHVVRSEVRGQRSEGSGRQVVLVNPHLGSRLIPPPPPHPTPPHSHLLLCSGSLRVTCCILVPVCSVKRIKPL